MATANPMIGGWDVHCRIRTTDAQAAFGTRLKLNS